MKWLVILVAVAIISACVVVIVVGMKKHNLLAKEVETKKEITKKEKILEEISVLDLLMSPSDSEFAQGTETIRTQIGRIEVVTPESLQEYIDDLDGKLVVLRCSYRDYKIFTNTKTPSRWNEEGVWVEGVYITVLRGKNGFPVGAAFGEKGRYYIEHMPCKPTTRPDWNAFYIDYPPMVDKEYYVIGQVNVFPFEEEGFEESDPDKVYFEGVDKWAVLRLVGRIDRTHIDTRGNWRTCRW